ncbi:hypothetical protein [Candidatus Nitrotoga sp. M5]|uniref:hypothetical protein n=1 Tax=Candidatus Nitrotoga sp. M5 TaxID=2890409 RepID=UPI001EF23D11|nr:hypothetical protein [Candidatus Nitrotoga sp. M5]CAH1385770.1 conserved membrane hypothetical protein [Candidatus Nitrotoga sp. M5]
MMRFVGLFALAGMLIPIVLRGAWVLVDRYLGSNLDIQVAIQKLTLVLWPSWLMGLADVPNNQEIQLFLILLAVNIILYAVLGVLIWLGLKSHVSFYGIAGIMMVALWWWVLTL